MQAGTLQLPRRRNMTAFFCPGWECIWSNKRMGLCLAVSCLTSQVKFLLSPLENHWMEMRRGPEALLAVLEFSVFSWQCQCTLAVVGRERRGCHSQGDDILSPWPLAQPYIQPLLRAVAERWLGILWAGRFLSQSLDLSTKQKSYRLLICS